ncbi:MAG: superinfection immunity protein [Nakamurella sp.]
MALFLILGIALYLLPSIIAFARHAPSPGSVLVVNLFFGWSVIGWVIALTMAVRSRQPQQTINIINQVGPQYYGQGQPAPANWDQQVGYQPQPGARQQFDGPGQHQQQFGQQPLFGQQSPFGERPAFGQQPPNARQQFDPRVMTEDTKFDQARYDRLRGNVDGRPDQPVHRDVTEQP